MQDIELDRIAGRKAADGAGEFAGILDGFTIYGRDHVAGLDAGLGSRAVGLRFRYQRAFSFSQTKAIRDILGYRLNLHADPATADGALILELCDHILHGRSGNRERNADTSTRRGVDRRVYADDFALHIEGRTARIALVDRRVDLNEVIVRAVADVATAGRDDAGSDGSAEAEGIADRENPVADPRLAGCEFCKRKVRPAFDLDQREIRTLVRANYLGGVGLSVVSCDFDLVGAIDNVIVGNRIAVRRDEEAGALAHHGAMAAMMVAHSGRR